MTSTSGPERADRPARVLVVCTGNVCRSPLVERLLRAALADLADAADLTDRADGVVVESAGTRALVGKLMTETAEAELVGQGGDATGFVSRQLTEAHLQAADLVVTATRAHRAEVVALLPRATRRTFTLRELDRLVADLGPQDLGDLGATPAERVRALPAAAAARRGHLVPGDPADDDVADPFGGTEADYRRTTGQVVGPVATLVRAIRG